MSLSDRRKVLAGLLGLSMTAACGFRPVYGNGGTGQALRGAVRVDDPVSRSDFQFVSAFEDILGRADAPRYGLAYTIEETEVGGGSIQGIGATRVQIFGVLRFTMTDLATGADVAAGEVNGNVAYSTTATQLATLTAQEDAKLRLMRILADALVTRLYTEPGVRTA